jgi:hypothetical protein
VGNVRGSKGVQILLGCRKYYLYIRNLYSMLERDDNFLVLYRICFVAFLLS